MSQHIASVTWIESRRYHVQSGSRPDIQHMVDLEEGWCGCEAIEFQRRKVCKHIIAAQTYEENITTMAAAGPVGLVLEPTPVRLAQ